MDSSYIVRKTARGEEEIKTRAGGITGNLRVMLILVDGNSSIAELVHKAQGLSDAPAALKTLAEGGYIEFVSPGAITYDGLKQELIRTAQEVLGDDATKIVKKLQEAPPTKEGLKEAASNCRKMVQLFIDEDKADQLLERCHDLLGQL